MLEIIKASAAQLATKVTLIAADDPNKETGEKAATGAQKASNGLNNVDPDKGGGKSLEEMIRLIINGVIGVIGIISVVMIILGGITYATSQGDPQKVKKGKDTILYGLIGLVIALLAFAIVNFVLGVFIGTSSESSGGES